MAVMKGCPTSMNACKLKKVETIGRVRTAKDTQSALRSGQLKARSLRFVVRRKQGFQRMNITKVLCVNFKTCRTKT